eukprot:CAMPEP_0194036104 /NCGR_PEP_ID=MMETSP0009_2-20130614/8485_1 /TAXON_ID=210454 /ORGANISM="Grammatophora oceanica, Strain CCMP 410" /LENGTH=537 /DNA_ID=CAMNT_0038677719 /DNA_START=49 /DNA_END=1662 /DNA_ORIENTATION=+
MKFATTTRTTTTLAVLLGVVVAAGVHQATALLRGIESEADSPCHSAANKDSCFATTDDNGMACEWCECSAIPSECLTADEAKLAPEGVFDCSSPSRRTKLDFITLVGDPVKDDFCDVNSKSGYMSIDQSAYDQNGEGKNLFYWQFDKRGTSEEDDDDTTPFIIWLTGGPGCSSSLALLTENGPCSVTPDGTGTQLNPYSWTEVANVLWLDQPAGVGFSFGEESDTNEQMISEDAYWFVQKFMDTYPQYAKQPLYIVGESYGGHYAPAIAHRIWLGNKKLEDGAQTLNLAGVAVGNGLTAPQEQYKWYPEMAFNNSHGIQVISEDEYNTMKAVVPNCVKLIEECNNGDGVINKFACQSAFYVCNLGLTSPYQATGLNPYDIREQCKVPPLCYDFSFVTKFMNSASTKEALHVNTKKSHSWASCNMGINLKFHVDWMKDFSPYIADLLNDDIPALIYAGDVDYICNYLGNKAWSYQLKWSGGDEFRAAPEHDWKDGSGLARTANGLTFLQVYDAGHMVPSDKPEVALDMIRTFVSGGEF